jgi:hypothetical protein
MQCRALHPAILTCLRFKCSAGAFSPASLSALICEGDHWRPLRGTFAEPFASLKFVPLPLACTVRSERAPPPPPPAPQDSNRK